MMIHVETLRTNYYLENPEVPFFQINAKILLKFNLFLISQN